VGDALFPSPRRKPKPLPVDVIAGSVRATSPALHAWFSHGCVFSFIFTHLFSSSSGFLPFEELPLFLDTAPVDAGPSVFTPPVS
jgi:hypothetical protein